MPYQLAYVSLSRSKLDEAMLADIIHVSETNNVREDITSVFMYHDGIFFQLLEGDREAVKACFNKRIQRDDRHGGFSPVWDGDVECRSFPDCAMGYLGPDEIGGYTKTTFKPLADLQKTSTLCIDQNKIAVELIRAIFSDFERRG